VHSYDDEEPRAETSKSGSVQADEEEDAQVVKKLRRSTVPARKLVAPTTGVPKSQTKEEAQKELANAMKEVERVHAKLSIANGRLSLAVAALSQSW
jgi:hypothetical protein